MLKQSFKAALIGGKVLTIGAVTSGALMGTSALAQTADVVTGGTTVVETPAQNTAVVPNVAAAPGAPVGAVSDPGYPLLEQLDNDEAIAQSLISQGFSDIHILREGAILTVNAQRNGQPTELVYSVANGSLVSVDGVELRGAPDATSNGQSAGISAGDDVGSDEGDGSDAGGDDGSDAGDGDGSDAGGGTDGGASDGGASDGSGSDGSDGGSDGAGGSDGSDGSGGSEGSGSDGGGSDGGGSDGGDSGGGESNG